MSSDIASAWGKLVDDAYDRYPVRATDEFSSFLNQLNTDERQAVIVWVFQSAVRNGGIQQWVDNGYARTAGELVAMLRTMDTPQAVVMASMIERFVNCYVNTEVADRGFGPNYWLHINADTENDSECDECDLPYWWSAEALNDHFYNDIVAKEFETEVEAYFSKGGDHA